MEWQTGMPKISTESTQLSFLTTDGIVNCTFRPMLTPEQYGELYALMKLESLSHEALGARLAEMASRWGTSFYINP